MNIFLRVASGLLVMSLAACFHEKEEESLSIPPPDISHLADFDEMRALPSVTLTDTDTALTYLNPMLRRLLSLVDIANQEIKILGSYASPVSPSDKVSARALDYVDNSAVTGFGGEPVNLGDAKSLADLRNTEVLFWDDRDENREYSAGDVWIRFIRSFLDSNLRTSDGSIYLFGLKNPSEVSLPELNFSMWMDFQYELAAGPFFVASNLELSVVRDKDSGYVTVAIRPAHPSLPAIIGYGGNGKKYAFEIDDLVIRFYADPQADADTFNDLESIEFSGDYVFVHPETKDSAAEEGKIEIVNSSFVFDYDAQTLRTLAATFKGADATVKVSTKVDYSQMDVTWETDTPESREFVTIFGVEDPVTGAINSAFDLINLD